MYAELSYQVVISMERVLLFLLLGVMITGELSAKLAAKSYWKKELEEELNDLGIREKWCFNKSSSLLYSGNEEDAMEYVESRRYEQLYAQTCSKLCSDKGMFYNSAKN